MRAKVDESCVGCGLCVSNVPEVFRFKEDGFAEAYREFSEEKKDDVQKAIYDCPVSAIHWDE